MEYKEEVKICPYNSSHAVEPLKYAKHIQRCRKANPHIITEICPYNSTHHILQHSMNLHLETCEDKLKFADFSFRESASASLQAGASAPETQFASFDPQEDWEAEAGTSARTVVNPEISILYSTNSRVPDASLGLGKSGRRNWRRIDALRIERIKNNQPIEDLEYPTADGGLISIGEMVFGSAWKECGQGYGEDGSNFNKSAKEIEDESFLDDSTAKKKKKRRRKKRPIPSNVESSDPSVDETIPPIRFERRNLERKNLQVRFQDPSIEREGEKTASSVVETSTKKKKKRKPKKPSVEEKLRLLNLGEPN